MITGPGPGGTGCSAYIRCSCVPACSIVCYCGALAPTRCAKRQGLGDIRRVLALLQPEPRTRVLNYRWTHVGRLASSATTGQRPATSDRPAAIARTHCSTASCEKSPSCPHRQHACQAARLRCCAVRRRLNIAPARSAPANAITSRKRPRSHTTRSLLASSPQATPYTPDKTAPRQQQRDSAPATASRESRTSRADRQDVPVSHPTQHWPSAILRGRAPRHIADQNTIPIAGGPKSATNHRPAEERRGVPWTRYRGRDWD